MDRSDITVAAEVQRSIHTARVADRPREDSDVDIDLVLLELVRQSATVRALITSRTTIDLRTLPHTLRSESARDHQASAEKSSVDDVMARSRDLAEQLHKSEVTGELFLLAAMQGRDVALTRFLKARGVTHHMLLAILPSVRSTDGSPARGGHGLATSPRFDVTRDELMHWLRDPSRYGRVDMWAELLATHRTLDGLSSAVLAAAGDLGFANVSPEFLDLGHPKGADPDQADPSQPRIDAVAETRVMLAERLAAERARGNRNRAELIGVDLNALEAAEPDLVRSAIRRAGSRDQLQRQLNDLRNRLARRTDPQLLHWWLNNRDTARVYGRTHVDMDGVDAGETRIHPEWFRKR